MSHLLPLKNERLLSTTPCVLKMDRAPRTGVLSASLTRSRGHFSSFRKVGTIRQNSPKASLSFFIRQRAIRHCISKLCPQFEGESTIRLRTPIRWFRLIVENKCDLNVPACIVFDDVVPYLDRTFFNPAILTSMYVSPLPAKEELASYVRSRLSTFFVLCSSPIASRRRKTLQARYI